LKEAGPCSVEMHNRIPASPTFVKRALFLAGLMIASRKKDAESTIEHVFHGTAPTNVDSILKDGMNPRLRKNGGDFFATEPTWSLDFAAPVKFAPYVYDSTMLIFLVLTLPPGFKSRSGVVVTMKKGRVRAANRRCDHAAVLSSIKFSPCRGCNPT
jgi:hypothetical protein